MQRLDEFVEKFYDELTLTQQLFADFVFQRGLVKKDKGSTAQKNEHLGEKDLSEKNKLVLSKFRKARKRRKTGYYSSEIARKRITYVGDISKTPRYKDASDSPENRCNKQVLRFQCNESPAVTHLDTISTHQQVNMESFATIFFSCLEFIT